MAFHGKTGKHLLLSQSQGKEKQQQVGGHSCVLHVKSGSLCTVEQGTLIIISFKASRLCC